MGASHGGDLVIMKALPAFLTGACFGAALMVVIYLFTGGAK